MPIIEAANRVNIKYENAKAIIRVFKTEGRLTKLNPGKQRVSKEERMRSVSCNKEKEHLDHMFDYGNHCR